MARTPFKQKRIPFTFRVSEEVLKGVGHIAIERRVSTNEMMQLALEDWLIQQSSPKSEGEWREIAADATYGPMLRALMDAYRAHSAPPAKAKKS